MKPIVITFAVLLVFLASCGKQSSDYKALKAQNDSLLNAKMELQREVDDYFAAMNQIQENIEKIKSTENIISLQPLGKDLTDDVR
jgi:cell division protein FtsB